jgi:hypothetical protein
MKNWLNRLFKDKSDVSSMRVMTMMSLIFGMMAALKGLDANVVAIFVGSAFGGKVSQKYLEVKSEMSESTSSQQ